QGANFVEVEADVASGGATDEGQGAGEGAPHPGVAAVLHDQLARPLRGGRAVAACQRVLVRFHPPTLAWPNRGTLPLSAGGGSGIQVRIARGRLRLRGETCEAASGRAVYAVRANRSRTGRPLPSCVT